MLSFTRKRLIVLFIFSALAIYAGIKFGPGSSAAKPKPAAALVPSVTATMTAAPTTDVGSNGAFVNPGDTLEYTVTLNNGAAVGAGNDATNTIFTDNLTDANLTLVAGSIKASPIAFDDAYPVTGNVRISTANGAASLLANDIRPTTGTNAGLTITTLAGDNTAAFSGTSAQGGQVTAATGDGSFQYNPPAGYEGADSFTYTVTDPDGLTSTGTVNITVAGMIWFVQAGAPAGGDGRLSAPFNCLTGAGCFDPVAADDAGDNIFLYSGAYTGGLTLLANQKLIGQGATTTLAGIAGITLATGSDPLPAVGGARPTVTTTIAATNAINLGSGNTLRGFDIGNSTASDISGSGYGTLTATEIALSGTGRTLNLTTGTLAATFDSITSSSSTGGPGMSLTGTGGNLTVTGAVSITGASTQGIAVATSTLNSTFGSTTVASPTTQGILIGTHTVGTLAFGNTTVTGGTDGVSFQNNASGSRTFGTLTVSGGSGNAFIHGASGGNVTVTGTTSLTSPGSAVSVASPGATNVINFQSAVTATSSTNLIAGVNWAGVAGAQLTFNSLTINRNSATALNATGGGTVTVTNGTGSITAVNHNGPAIVAANVTLNANFSGINCASAATSCVSLNTVAGTSNFGNGSLSTSSGTVFDVVGGSATTIFSGGITQANNAALVSVSGGHSTGTIQFGTGTLSATNGTGLQFDNADGNYTFNGTTTLNGGDAGIDITNGSSGQFSFGSGTSITNPSGIAYREDTSTGNVNIDGTISKTNNAANAVSINAKSGGLTGFNGVVTATTTTANAVNLTSNAGGSITFGGGLALNTTSGIGFNATGGGTVIAAQTPPITVNTIASTTGTALNVANTTIGASGLTFTSISSNGATNGIVLNTTGSSGGLVVTGDTGSTNNSSGGTITGGTTGISLNSTRNVSLDQMNIQSSSRYGIQGTAVTNFTFTNGTINNSGTSLTAQDSNIGFNGNGTPVSGTTYISGTLTVTGSTLNNSFYHGITVRQDVGTITNLNISNNSFTSSTVSANSNGSAIDIDPTGNVSTAATVVTGTINNNAITNFPSGAGIQLLGGNTASSSAPYGAIGCVDATPVGCSGASTVTVSGNSIAGASVAVPLGTNGIATQVNGRGQSRITISGNGTAGSRMRNFAGSAIVYGCTGRSVCNGQISNNFIDGGANIVGSPAISVGVDATFANTDNANFTLFISANDVNPGSDGNGILATARASSGNGIYTIKSNNIAAPRSGVRQGIRVDAGNASSVDDAVCLDIAGNTSNFSVGQPAAMGIGLRKQGTTSTTNDFSIENLASFMTPGPENLVNGQNPAGNGTLLLSATSGFSSCTAPNRPAQDTTEPTIKGFDTLSEFFEAVKQNRAGVPANELPAGGPLVNGGMVEANFAKEPQITEKYQSRVVVPGTPALNIELTSGIIKNSPKAVEWSSSDTALASAAIEIDSGNVEPASASIEWAYADIETEPAAIETPAALEDTPSTFGAIALLVDKMASGMSPTVYSQATDSDAPQAGTVTVNGAGSGFTLPAGKSTVITFRATISNPTTPVNTFSVSNQGSVSGTGFGPILTDDPGVAGAANPTVTTVVQPPTITKSFTPASILLDQQSTLTLTINNTNPGTAVTGITVTDVFPANVVVASPLTASTTCGAGTLQNNSGGVLAVGDPGIKLVGGTRAANQACTVTVKVRGTTGGTYNNTTGNVASFEGFVGTTASSTLTVGTLTASELSISGRVLTSEGRGIRNARVIITGNSLPQPISVFTGINGTYHVEGLTAGETYIVTVQTRRFVFENPNRVVTLIDNVTDADFVGTAGAGREQ